MSDKCIYAFTHKKNSDEKAIKEDTKNDEYTRKIVDLLSDRVDVIVSGNGLQQWLKVSDKCQAWLSGIGWGGYGCID